MLIKFKTIKEVHIILSFPVPPHIFFLSLGGRDAELPTGRIMRHQEPKVESHWPGVICCKDFAKKYQVLKHCLA